MSEVTPLPPRPIRTTPPPLSPVDSVDFDDYGGPPLYDSTPPSGVSPLRRTYAKPPSSDKATPSPPSPATPERPEATIGTQERSQSLLPPVAPYVGRQPKWYDDYVMALAVLAGLTYAIWQARRPRPERGKAPVARPVEQARVSRTKVNKRHHRH